MIRVEASNTVYAIYYATNYKVLRRIIVPHIEHLFDGAHSTPSANPLSMCQQEITMRRQIGKTTSSAQLARCPRAQGTRTGCSSPTSLASETVTTSSPAGSSRPTRICSCPTTGWPPSEWSLAKVTNRIHS